MTLQIRSHTFTKIELTLVHSNKLQILLVTLLSLFINNFVTAQTPALKKELNATTQLPQKEIPQVSPNATNSEELITSETTPIQDKDSVIVKELLSNRVYYKAIDSIMINQRLKQMYLYNQAEITYGDINIQAGKIIINYDKNEVYAFGISDSIEYNQSPVFKQGENIIKPDSIRYNFNTKKALIFNSKSEQTGMNLNASYTKKENDSVYFVKDLILTTSKNLEDPEYHIKIRKAKFVPKKKIVSGPANLFIYGVPTPIGVPFSYFPLTEERASGFIIPSFGENNQRGYFIQNGGYYFAVNDYLDLTVLGDFYTNGSYGYNISSTYRVNYKFNGQFGFRYENLITSERGFPDYGKSTVYNLRWSHSQDAKSNPNSRFSASVNLGSSDYYSQSTNQYNANNNLVNTLSSSISYSKSFEGKYGGNFALTATHSQNTNTQEINMTLPSIQGGLNRIYPFEPKVGSKKGMLQNINLQYSFAAENRIKTTDEFFFKSQMFDDAKMGVRHSIPISTNFKVFKYFSLSTGGNFNHIWNFEKTHKSFNEDTQEEVITINKGFTTYSTYNFSSSIGTTIYGMYNFDKKDLSKKIKALRHVVRPNLSYSINPAFDQYYESYKKNIITADGTTYEDVEYSPYETSIYALPGKTFSSNIGLNIGNSIEAKVRDKVTDSTEITYRKVAILNNLNISTSYDIAGDSLQLKPVSISGGTQLAKNKLNINFSMSLDPYALDNNNKRINTFNAAQNGSLFRLTNANLTLNYSFSSKDFEKGKDNKQNKSNSSTTFNSTEDLLGNTNDLSTSSFDNNEDDTPADVKLYNYKIPWSLRIAYSIAYNNFSRENEISSNSLMFSGDVELAPRWKVGISSGYDIKDNGFTHTNLRFERDLLSWKMNFNWVPFSANKSWFFFIGIKSSILSDLKWDKRRDRDKLIN